MVEVVGTYPSMNCTVGRDVLDNADETIKFFETFGSRITFSRMIGQYGISLSEFNTFLDKAAKKHLMCAEAVMIVRCTEECVEQG